MFHLNQEKGKPFGMERSNYKRMQSDKALSVLTFSPKETLSKLG
jgi:hypothetical protein